MISMKATDAKMVSIFHIERLLACISCGGEITCDAVVAVCSSCGECYPVREGRVFFTEVPTEYEGTSMTSARDNKSQWSVWRKKCFVFFKEHLSSMPDGITLLDVGTGQGQFFELYHRFKTVGIDFRPFSSVQVVADITKRLPFQGGSFDVVVASNTLEHIPNTEEALAELHRVLKPGGLLLVTIPFLMRIHQKPYDFNRYTHYKLLWLFRRALFKDIETSALSEPVEVYRSIQRHFFSYVIHSNFSSHRGVDILARALVRALWRFEWLLLFFCRGLYRHAPQTPDFTEGYGIVARK